MSFNFNEKLFKEFPPVETGEWTDRINADLKDEDFKKKLIWRTDEGFDLKPFYRREDINDLAFIHTIPGKKPFVRGSLKENNHWRIRQNISVEDYRNANAKAQEILTRGVDSLGFIHKDPRAINRANLERLTSGIPLEDIEINFISEGKAKEIHKTLQEILAVKGKDPAKVKGAIECDPFSRLISNRRLYITHESELDYLAELIIDSSIFPYFRIINVNTENFSGAGSDIITELAFGLSLGNEYLSALNDRSVTAGLAASKIKFSFRTGPNYFFEIAKLRSARLLWSIIAERYHPGNMTGADMEIHCVTGRWNKTRSDPYTNMLRTQTEAMSAILGGTNSLTVEPFDIAFRAPDEFSERIARNQQLLLRDESCFNRVIDPAGGSYYIEKLTSLITIYSWKLFIEVEERGGFFKALNQGFIHERLKRPDWKRFNQTKNRSKTGCYETSVQL